LTARDQSRAAIAFGEEARRFDERRWPH